MAKKKQTTTNNDIEQILESAQKQDYPELFAIFLLATKGLMESGTDKRRETWAALVKKIRENPHVWPEADEPVVAGDILGESALHVAEQIIFQNLPRRQSTDVIRMKLSREYRRAVKEANKPEQSTASKRGRRPKYGHVDVRAMQKSFDGHLKNGCSTKKYAWSKVAEEYGFPSGDAARTYVRVNPPK